jgi:basic amino acid/polyamine antiporter, APA family
VSDGSSRDRAARSPPGSPPSRPLSAWSAGALVVGSMVGTGVFTTSGLLMQLAGSRQGVLLIWALGGLVALCGAAVYAELGALMPRVGGEYVYLSRAFHPMVGFVSGWIALLAGFAAPVAAGSVAFAGYLRAAGLPLPVGVAEAALIVAFTALHALEVVWAARLQLALTILNVALLLALTGFGAWSLLTGAGSGSSLLIDAPVAAPSLSWVGLAVGLVIVSYSYFGWNAAAYVAAEIREPQRTLPRVLVGGALLVTGLYVALNAVFVHALPPAALAGKVEVAQLAARALWGEGPARALSLVIAGILAASVSALVMTGPRIYLAMAEDGLFAQIFARRNVRGAPSAGVLLQGVLALFFALTATFDGLIVYIGFTLTLSAGATVLAAVWLRLRQPDLPRPYRTPLWPLPPLLYILLCLWMAGHAALERPAETAAGAATVALGAAAYWLWRRRRGQSRGIVT